MTIKGSKGVTLCWIRFLRFKMRPIVVYKFNNTQPTKCMQIIYCRVYLPSQKYIDVTWVSCTTMLSAVLWSRALAFKVFKPRMPLGLIRHVQAAWWRELVQWRHDEVIKWAGIGRMRAREREWESAHTHTHTHRCNPVLHTVCKSDNKHRSTHCTLMCPAARPPPQGANHRCGLVSGSDAAGQHPLCGQWVRRAAGRQGGVLLWFQGCLLLDGVRLCAGSDGHGRRLEKSVGSERGGGAKEPDHRLQVSLWSDCVMFKCLWKC